MDHKLRFIEVARELRLMADSKKEISWLLLHEAANYLDEYYKIYHHVEQLKDCTKYFSDLLKYKEKNNVY